MFPLRRVLPLLIAGLALSAPGRAQFVDNFDGPKLEGWFQMTGDGTPTLQVVLQDGQARMLVDGTTDPYNVWWTFIKRDITRYLDLEKLKDPAYELRVEARVRSSHAPRRVNFMLNTQRTTNYHEHLREFDLPDTGWHTISFTTRDFDAGPGDTVFVQFCVTDYGPGKYEVDVDYYHADVVRPDAVGPDVGEPLVYHPPIQDPHTFSQHLPASDDSVINPNFAGVNFNDWHVEETTGTARILTVDATNSAILRWDLSKFHGRQADGAGVLELTTCSAPQGGKYIEHFGEDLGVEFGKVRIFEILGGDPAWNQEKVTYSSLLHGENATDVFNSQMIQDIEVSEKPGTKSYATLPRPVMQRLLDGKTKGLVIRPLGALAASVYASEDQEGRGPKLHFSVKTEQGEATGR